MADVVGIRFKRAGKVYYFDPAGIDMEVSDRVIVKTTRGLEMGEIVITPHQVMDSEVKEQLKPVVRKATSEDIEQTQEQQKMTAEALVECNNLIEKMELPMKLLTAEYSFSGKRLTFFFSASERVDFRELVKELTSRLKVRVELRQVGPRDGAKLIDGYGRCGRRLCCSSFLTEFEPVSIRMAKEQELPLNPVKISGVCGRLMCCLAYEADLYRAMRGKMPKKGQRVMTKSGTAVVTGGNLIKQTIFLELKSGAIIEEPLSEITAEGEQTQKEQQPKKKT
ncbi:MAG: stage 0 sporulation family protein [Dehalococcoidales bacterium]